MTTIELKVGGMTCGGCEGSVTRALQRLEGVTEVSADHASGKVVVTAEGALDPDAVRNAVEDAGYLVVPAGATGLPTL